MKGERRALGRGPGTGCGGGGRLRVPPQARLSLLQVRGFCGGGRQRLPGNFPRSVSGDKSRAGGQATKGPRPPRVVAWAAWLQAGHGLGGYIQQGARKCGEPGSCGAPGELPTLRSRSENFAAAAREGSRGVAVRPRGRCWWWLGGGGRRSPAGALRFEFLSCSPPPPLGAGRRPRGRDCSLPGLRPPRPASQGRAPGPALLSFLLPASLERFPAPPPAEDGCPGLGGGRVIASAAPYSRCPFFLPWPFLLRLDAPPRPQPSRAGGSADGRRVARPSGADSIILQHQRHLVRPPARPPLQQAN